MLNQPIPAKQLVILSGKGGTGKTSLTAAFAHLTNTCNNPVEAVMVDADVDAANLSLVLQPEPVDTHAFMGGGLAEIDENLCTGCGACVEVCRYDAILPHKTLPSVYWIDPIACDGCAACVYACPTETVRMVPQQEGCWFYSKTPFGGLFHAELFPGRENSGKLVTLVKQKAKLWAEDNRLDLVIVDGPPGIGCPVISACAGADLGLLVAEPGMAGLSDLKRVHGVLQHFRVPVVICINKADIYPVGAQEIHAFADEAGIEVIGEIPYDEAIPRAMMNGVPATMENPDAPASKHIRHIWENTCQYLFGKRVTNV